MSDPCNYYLINLKILTLILLWCFWNSQVLFFDSSTIKLKKTIPKSMGIVDISGNIHFGKLIESFHLLNLATNYANQFNFFSEISNYIKGTQKTIKNALYFILKSFCSQCI